MFTLVIWRDNATLVWPNLPVAAEGSPERLVFAKIMFAKIMFARIMIARIMFARIMFAKIMFAKMMFAKIMGQFCGFHPLAKWQQSGQ